MLADTTCAYQACYLQALRIKKQQAVFRRGTQPDDASRFSFCSQAKYTEGKASIRSLKLQKLSMLIFILKVITLYIHLLMYISAVLRQILIFLFVGSDAIC